MLTIFARREPSTDAWVLANISDEAREKHWHDVVLYRDRECTQRAGVIPVGQTQPTRRNKYQILNCHRYKLEWVQA